MTVNNSFIKNTIDEAIDEMKGTEKKVGDFWHRLGPGLTTGASDDDPSGIATYSQVGAKYGFQFLWMSLFSFPLMAVVQEMCARIGMVTGQGLAANIRQHYSKGILYICTFLLLVANVFNIGADLGAMAKGFQLLFPKAEFGLAVFIFGIVGLLMQIFISYANYAKYLKYLALVLFSYILSAMFIDLDWSVLMQHTLIPSMSFSKESIVIVCAVLGTTISPYLFFWQTSQEVEEEILHSKVAGVVDGLGNVNIDVSVTVDANSKPVEITDKNIKDMRVDVWSGMFISNVVMFFIIAVCGATLFANNINNITTASDAALALRPFAGNFAYMLFAIGIIGTGMLAIPVLAGSSAYAVSESLGWKFGLYRKLKEAYAFYGVIILSVFVGIGLNFMGIDPIKALIYSAVVNGMVSPVILYFIVRLSSREDIMRGRTNGPVLKLIGWATVLIMSVVSLLTLRVLFF